MKQYSDQQKLIRDNLERFFRGYFKVLVSDGLLQANAIQEHDIKYCVDRVIYEYRDAEIKTMLESMHGGKDNAQLR